MRNVILKTASPIAVEAVVRTLPDRREVVKGFWENNKIFAKIFFGKNAKKYYKRDFSGVQLLSTSNIPTPELLYQGELAEDNSYVLIFKAIEPSQNVEMLWEKLNKKERFRLAKALVVAVATHHNAGLVQTDLYLKNFLFSEEVVYTLDGDGIRKQYSLPPKIAVKNLCVLLSKFDVLDLEAWLPELIVAYQQSCKEPTELSLDLVKQAVHIHRKYVATRYADQKVFRTCSDVNVSTGNSFSATSVQFLSLNLPQDINQYDVLIDAKTTLKSGKTCTVALANMQGTDVVIKRYNIKSFSHAIGRMFRRTRASISWANAHRLQLLGIATANPIALLEKRVMGVFRGKAYFLSEFVDAPDMAIFFSNTKNNQLRSEAIKQTVELFYRLSLLKISHGDMKASNIKVIADGRPLLIDLDSMQQHSYDFFAKRAHARDIKRFMQNWKDEPSLYNAFVKGFKVVYADHSLLQAAQISQ